jgi:predicted nuclease with TOPRIM domain
LVEQALKQTKEVAEMRKQLFELRKRNEQLDQEGKQLLETFQKLRDSTSRHRPSPEIEKLQRQVRILEELIIALIGASGVDWVGDSRLSRLVLEAGNSLRQ